MRDTIDAPELDIPRRRARVVLAAILVVAFALRLVYVLQSRASPFFDDPQMDALYHVEWARAFAAGQDFQPGPFFRAPLYPWFLGILFRCFGDDLFLPRIVQAAIGTLSCALVYLVGARAFDRRTGLVAAAIAATYWILIYFDGELLLPVLEVPTCLLAIWLVLRARERASAWRVALAGLALGLAAIVRPNVLVLAPLFAGWLAWNASASWRKRLATAALYAAALFVPILPLTAYNAFVGHDRVLISSQSGVNLYIGNNEHSDGSSAIVPGTRPDWWGGYYDSIALAESGAGRKLKPSEVSDWYTERALRFWREHPAQALSLLLFKLRLYWTDWELGNNHDERFFALEFGPVLRWLPIGFGVLAPFGLLGFLLATRRIRTLFPLWIFLPLYTASVVTFFVCARFRVPVLPVMMVFAAFAVVELVDAFLDAFLDALGGREPRARRTLLLSALFLVPCALLVRAVPSSVDRTRAKGLWEMGIAAMNHGDPRAAVDWFRQSIDANGRFPIVQKDLGLALVALGQRDEAEATLRRALALDPASFETWRALFDLLVNAGRLPEAAAAARELVRIAPTNALAHDALGRAEFSTADDVQRRGGDPHERRVHLEAAEASFARVLELARDADTRFNAGFGLGEVRSQLGHDAEALQGYDAALSARLVPDDAGWFWQCHKQRCGALRRLGQADRAKADAQRAIREHPADPRGPAALREFLERP